MNWLTKILGIKNNDDYIEENRCLIRELEKKLEDYETYIAVGVVPNNTSVNYKKNKLLAEARNKGYFNENVCFKSTDKTIKKYYKYFPFLNVDAYSYINGQLFIPVIDINEEDYGTNIICIYDNGKWSKIKSLLIKPV